MQWQLAFEDSFATFQGVSPSKERKGYIAVDSTASCRFLCETPPDSIPGEEAGLHPRRRAFKVYTGEIE
jgi:hypothetical protein